ncbi:hypothetical protein BKA64DRAFT_656077 [Cadophora sp. MPI-SDFR-AT-0126]|nr:hypothetical protein BKA64DRAFT_656077 [Leotiomycetes sp. MPI-SDFR-AT-0126]
MAPAKWKCAYPDCAAAAKNEGGLVEHWEEFHFEEDYPGPLKNTKANKASSKGSTAKAAVSRATSVVNGMSAAPLAARGSSGNGGQKAMAMPSGMHQENEGEDGEDDMDLNYEPGGGNGLDEDMGASSNGGTALGTAAKRKATGTPSESRPSTPPSLISSHPIRYHTLEQSTNIVSQKSAPPSKKQATRPSTSKSIPKNLLNRLHTTKATTPRAPATRRGAITDRSEDDDTPDITPRTLGARAIARLTEKASNDPSRDLQPIRRPLPPRFQEWNSDLDSDIGAHDSSSDDDEPPVPQQPPVNTLSDPQIDPFYNQDLSDSGASIGISEDENGIPRPYDPSLPGSDPLHPFSTSAKYRVMPPRGIVKNPDGTTIDFDACMAFPDIPDPAALNKKAILKMNDVNESVAAPHKVVLMSFSDNIATPEINWAVRRNRLSSTNPNTLSNPSDTIGEPLSPPLHPSASSLSTTGDAIMRAYIEANNRAKMKAKAKKNGKGKVGGDGEVRKKKKASRLPKYEKRKYTWKDSTRKNKGRLYDSRKAEKDAEGQAEGK